MRRCPNCKTQYSCGCQKRTASDGTEGCSSCIGSYEAQLKAKAQAAINTAQTVTPTATYKQ